MVPAVIQGEPRVHAHSPSQQRHGGFTLVELAVTVAILAILIAIAVPSFTVVVNNNRLASQANALVGALQYARTESVRLNQRVVLCQTADGTDHLRGPPHWKRGQQYPPGRRSESGGTSR